MKIVPLFGAGTYGKSAVVTRQRRVNVYVELRKDKDKTKLSIYGSPALHWWYSFSSSNEPARAMIATTGQLWVIHGTSLSQIPNGTAQGSLVGSTAIPVLTTLTGLMGIAYNVVQLVLVDGISGMLYTLATGIWTTIGGGFPTGAKTVTYVAGFFVAEKPGTQQLFASNFNDGTTWNALAFAYAAGDSDNVLAVDNVVGNLVSFSERHLEFWQNVGASPWPFAPILSAFAKFGLAAIYSRVHIGDDLYFLAQTPEGQVQIAKIQGFRVVVVSDSDLDFVLNQLTSVSDATALMYQMGSHKVYQINFPTDNRSFALDTTTEVWTEVQTGTNTSSSARHRCNISAYSAGSVFAADYLTGTLYKYVDTEYQDTIPIYTGGSFAGTTTDPILREIISRHVLSNFNRVRISLVYLDMETGIGLSSGQGSDPVIGIEYSKDNGRTWSAQRFARIGAIGEYLTRVLWRRFGSARDATFRFRMTDPIKFVVAEAALKIAERQPAEKTG